MKKRKRFSGVLLVIAALIIMQLPVSEADAATSSASDFKIEGGVLVKYRGTQTNVSIPDTVEAIGEGAFEDNTRVELVVIPKSVKRIEPYAFWGCDHLDTVVLGKGLTAVGDYAFAGCGGLEQMTIPSNIKSIGISAFADCVNLKDVSIPAETVDIHETAFDGCYQLTIHSVAGTAADEFAQAFYERQKEMPEYQDVPDYSEDDNTGDSNVITPVPVPVPEITQTPSATPVPGNVLSSTQIVGNQAVFFMDNTLPEVMSSQEGFSGTAEKETAAPVGDLMQEVTDVGVDKYTVVDNRIIADQAYYRDISLGEVAIPEGIVEIGQFAFARSSVTGVTVPAGTTDICYGAFYHCDNLARVSLPDSIMLVEPKAFSYTPWVKNFLEGMTVEGNESSDENYLISGGVLVAYRGTGGEVTVPDGVRVIGAEVFWNHSEIESVALPESVTVIGEGAFENCAALTSLTMGDQVRQIKDRAFDGCNLEKVVLPESVEEVGLKALGQAQAEFAGEPFDIPNSYETSAARLSNEDYRESVSSEQEEDEREVGVTVEGMDQAYASLEAAARSYTLKIAALEDISAVEHAIDRSFQTSAPEGMAVFQMELTDSSGIPITRLGRQELTIIMPVPESLTGQKLQILLLDRNGQPQLLKTERVEMDGRESLRFQTNYVSVFAVYGLGAADAREEVQELSVDMMSLSKAPDAEVGGVSLPQAAKMIASGLLFTAGVVLIAVSRAQKR